MDKEQFITSVLKAAVQIQKKYGLPAASITAQACLETGYGKSVCKDATTGQYSYNLFNIKGDGPAGSVQVKTWEVYNGARTTVMASFRAYHSYEESFADYVKLITGSKRYAPAVAARDNPDEYASQLQKCGYATDPDYSAKLISIMNQCGLREKANKELMDMAIEKWQEDMGVSAIDELASSGLLSDPEEWKKKVASNAPIWLLMEMLRRLNERITDMR